MSLNTSAQSRFYVGMGGGGVADCSEGAKFRGMLPRDNLQKRGLRGAEVHAHAFSCW